MTSDDCLGKAIANSPQLVADVVRSLARPVHDADDLARYLQNCVDVAVRVVADADRADIATRVCGRPAAASCTAPPAPDHPEWRSPVAADTGLGSPHVVALGPPGAPLGELTLHTRTGRGLDEDARHLVEVIASHAARSLADLDRLHAAETLAAQLQAALAGRAPIEQAKGMLMAEHHITGDAAFGLLRTESQNSNTRLHDLAVAYVAAVSRPRA